MDDLDEKLAIAGSHAARRLREREAAFAEEDERRDGKRLEILARYQAVKEQIIELRETLSPKRDYLAAQGGAIALDMELSKLSHAVQVFKFGLRTLEDILGFTNMATVDVAIRQLTTLDVGNWASAADVIGGLRHQCPGDFRPTVQMAINNIENSIEKYNARCAALGKESKAAGYFLLPDYSPQEPAKPRVIVSKPPDDAA